MRPREDRPAATGSKKQPGPATTASNAPLVVQPKLLLGPADDPFERQAEQVAQNVGSGGSPQPAGPLLSRKPTHSDSAIDPGLESDIRQARGGGQPLPEHVRQPMEQSMGADFSRVRIHTDDHADRLNQALHARAFTTGQDIFFRRSEYRPGSQNTHAILAHELTHVLQQTGLNGGIHSNLPPASPDPLVQRMLTPLGKKSNKRGDAPDELFDKWVNQQNRFELDKKNNRLTKARMEAYSKLLARLYSYELLDPGHKIIKDQYAALEAAYESLPGASEERALNTLNDASENEVDDAIELIEIFKGYRKVFQSSDGDIEARAEAAAKFKKIVGKEPGRFETLIDAMLVAGVTVQLHQEYQREFLKASSSLKTFLGLEIKGGTHFELDVMEDLKIALKAFASAKGGIFGEAELAAALRAGQAEARVAISAEGMVGAQASLSGEIEIGKDGIKVSGEAGAFAGLELGVKPEFSLSYEGTPLFELRTEITAALGLGAKVSGKFHIENGKVILGAQLFAALGIGGGFGFELALDFSRLVKIASDVKEKIETLAEVIRNRLVRLLTGKEGKRPVPDYYAKAFTSTLEHALKSGIYEDRDNKGLAVPLKRVNKNLRGVFKYFFTNFDWDQVIIDALVKIYGSQATNGITVKDRKITSYDGTYALAIPKNLPVHEGLAARLHWGSR
jgi:hypothetical protein